ncbi:MULTISPECIES: DNA-directed RNA polymerase subunit beta' [Pseudonocardia]|uniref:DNA-directed RNA polymerase subunit beta' n=1 Tax=Pseudonocardia dioxanivorans (strain ATCC 55486 / DSM 44775 / JCM 13855 / CB1190) TaxID=675635 RepID=F4CWF0_PSEUX|nr:DNA-directed RNA polymerase subunit beta' [Pseudonocardia dioxanivorans]AEA27568.1 DNA-directed RNA polymerase subunit beta' [Pseudonocardia dioxanivorans CB1190]GJF06819.1 DNA-directed RNA polymerase subunit beta' [Pseudonocardia sp. D17]
MLDVNFFDELRIGLATAEDIRQWSHGEVKKPETINYRTLKPEKDGLFCEKIFGPTRDWECYCGKYKRVRFKGIICERCGVEVTRAKVRRERMGHIELAAPVTHIWYFKGVPSRLGYLLDLAPKDLEKIIYFAAYVITSVNTELRHQDLSTLENEMTVERKKVEQRRDTDLEARAQKLEADLAELEAEGAKSDVRRKVKEGGEREMRQLRDRAQRELDRLDEIWTTFTKLDVQQLIADEGLYRELYDRYGDYFTGSMGAEAIQKLLETFDIEAEAENLRETIRSGKGQKKLRALKRLKVVAAFQSTGNSPMGMVLDCVPVIPPDLRPMVQLDGGRFATSDLNDLYRRVINRNNRLKRLIDLGAPEIIVNNEKRMLQEAVDALFDNGRRGRPVTGPGNRPLKSLSDLLKGKQGRFRQNLLGKRVDYSGRSVIVVGPQLKLHQCGLPKQMALELFKPFVMKRLVDLNHAQNIKSAKRMVERGRSQVWDVLEEVISEHPVLLNRAPTLHRLGIQAFEPQLVEGKAIQLHPLVCEAFNADFDGDQMAVHLPLSAEAQSEARVLMLSSNNILSPASGRPLAMPRLDMVTGLFHLTRERPGATGDGNIYGSVAEAIMAYDRKVLHLQAPIKIRLPGVTPVAGVELEDGEVWLAETTLGRVLFNELLPAGYPFVNEPLPKKRQAAIINDLAERYSMTEVAQCLDRLKDAGFYWATRSGVTMAIDDVVVPPNKQEILDGYEAKADQVNKRYQRGALSHQERNDEMVKIWTQASEEVAKAMEDNFPEDNPIPTIVKSGAAGNMTQVRQLAGMRGLVANPKGEYIPRPIKANFREGLSVLEYFISTHGTRKGLADTALRTADSGYLTRRLVDVSQDVIVREIDCGTSRSVAMAVTEETSDGRLIPHRYIRTSVYARCSAEEVVGPDGEVIVAKGGDLGDPALDALVAAGVRQIKVRSALTCESATGICAMCYGRSMATGKLVDVGEAVGIVAAQSIGEPGTQLTMRTFHQGGVAGDDITTGLPRVTELFEARVPKGKAPIADVDGRIRIEDGDRFWKITLTPDDGGEEIVYEKLSKRQWLAMTTVDGQERPLADGDHVQVGQLLLEGTADPHEVLRVMGPREVQLHLVREVQKVYRTQSVDIHDKHIEVIVRQMLRRVTIIDSGATEFLPGALAERGEFESENRRVVAEGNEPASGRPVLMGITKASLATESWLSAASFQETTRILTDAAINGKRDKLVGLKENVIIGKLIPAGTGIGRYRNIQVQPTEEARAAAYALPNYDDGYYSPDVFGTGTGAAVPLDDYDFGRDYR